jgi:glycosyltransferase involved in cell wall biosynthesis
MIKTIREHKKPNILPNIIGLVYNPGRLDRLDACRRGDVPSEFFYGAIELESQGLEIRFFETDPSTPVYWPCAAFNFLGQNGPVKLDGLFMQSTRNLLNQLNDCDVVVGTTGGHAFALAVWQSLGCLRTPIVGIHAGLLVHKINIWRRYSTAFLLRRMQSMLFGESELEPMYKTFPGIHGHVHVNQFGVDTSFWTPGPASKSGYVLAVGNSGRRDYPTLIEAAKHLPYRVLLLTAQTIPSPLPPNVEHIRGTYAEGVSDAQLRDLYRGASCVVVPLKPTNQPSGQSVTLQAMACGRPVVLTDTKGIWSHDTVRDGETLLLTPSGDVSKLAQKIILIIGNKEFSENLGMSARKAVLRSATIQSFADRLFYICSLDHKYIKGDMDGKKYG